MAWNHPTMKDGNVKKVRADGHRLWFALLVVLIVAISALLVVKSFSSEEDSPAGAITYKKQTGARKDRKASVGSRIKGFEKDLEEDRITSGERKERRRQENSGLANGVDDVLKRAMLKRKAAEDALAEQNKDIIEKANAAQSLEEKKRIVEEALRERYGGLIEKSK